MSREGDALTLSWMRRPCWPRPGRRCIAGASGAIANAVGPDDESERYCGVKRERAV